MSHYTYTVAEENSEPEGMGLCGSFEEAASEYAELHAAPADEKTYWLSLHVVRSDGVPDRQKVAIHPEVKCTSKFGHYFSSDFEAVGGLRENPGVFGTARNGTFVVEVCEHCKVFKTTQSGAQDPIDGERGLTAISYSAEQERWALR